MTTQTKVLTGGYRINDTLFDASGHPCTTEAWAAHKYAVASYHNGGKPHVVGWFTPRG